MSRKLSKAQSSYYMRTDKRGEANGCLFVDKKPTQVYET